MISNSATAVAVPFDPAQRLRDLATLVERDLIDNGGLRWRLFVLVDWIDAEQKDRTARFVDECLEMHR